MTRVFDVDGAEVSSAAFKAGGQASDVGPFERWVAKRMTFADFATAATTVSTLSFSLPAHTIIHDAAIELETDFAGGSVSAATAALGVSGGDVDAFIEEIDVFTGATNDELASYNTLTTRGTGLADPTSGDEHPLHGYYVGTSAIEVDTTLVTTTANADTLTAGSLIMYLKISNPKGAWVDG